jgi:hypothetical protein
MKAGVAVYHLIRLSSKNCRVAIKNVGNQPPSGYLQKLCTPCFIEKIFDIVITRYEFIASNKVLLSFEFVKRWSSLLDNVTMWYEL